MSLDTLALFAVAALILAATPGPDMLLCLSRALAQGPVAGLLTLLGINVGCAIYGLAVGLGLASIFAALPALFDLVRAIGVVYLLWLAWQTLRAPAPGVPPDTPMARDAAFRLFRQGLATNLLNPKVALFFTALFPQFMTPAAGPVLVQAMALTAIFCAIGFSLNAALVLFAHRLTRWLRGHGNGRWGRWLLAATFGGLAARLAFESR